MKAQQVTEIFECCFGRRYSTQLCGGAAEPLYLPATKDRCAQLYFRADYAASALHEVAHWCLAGAKRRDLVDFGYQYVPAPRSPLQQMQFFSAELRSQSLESYLAEAAGVRFTISTDNFALDGTLDANTIEQEGLFARQLLDQGLATQSWLETKAGMRAREFAVALRSARG
jgi:elongation factor P hydroxylase